MKTRKSLLTGDFIRRLGAAGGGLVLVASLLARAEIVAPYLPDADTLHLWHLDEPVVPINDALAAGVNLAQLENGATLGNESYVGAKNFGTALGTYVGNPAVPPGSAGQSAGLSSLGFQNGPGDNVAVNYAGPRDAFTYEAIVRIDFDPTANYGPDGLGRGKTPFMQILSGDADENASRVFQFRLAPVGTLNGNPQPLLEFINLNQGNHIQSLTAPIPTDGPQAIRAGKWYHVAVTYTGAANEPGNLRFYWTTLRPEQSRAHEIGSGQMTFSLPAGCSPDLAIGQTGRQSPVAPKPNNNFVGLIDEVRISGVARSPVQMLFGGRDVAVAQPAAGVQPATEPKPAATTPPAKVADVAALPPVASPKVELLEPATLMSGAVARGPTNKPQIALLFSCRESDGTTAATVETLKAHQVKASFFVTRDFLQPAANRLLVQSLLVQGQYVGLQADSWGAWGGSSPLPPAVEADFKQLAAFGVPARDIRYFLPTAEQLNPASAERARDWGLIMVAGTPGTLSFATASSEGGTDFVSSQGILESILSAEQHGGLNGYLLLFRLDAGARRTDKFYTRFGELVNTLRGRGYEFVRVDQLLDVSFPRPKPQPALVDLKRP
jgi:peptidoglycan/xylan/chitin deacetylase (PgdA/CDA1 family)